jgi:hypothetical protein
MRRRGQISTFILLEAALTTMSRLHSTEGSRAQANRKAWFVLATAVLSVGMFAQTGIPAAAAAPKSGSTPQTISAQSWSVYTPLAAPARLVNGVAISPGTPVNVTVAGGSTGVPANAQSVVVNLTSANNVDAGYLQAFPTGGSTTSSAVNYYYPNQLISTLATVPVGTGGQITISTHVNTNLFVDEQGYYAPAGSSSSAGQYKALTPARLSDTRSGTPLSSGGTMRVQVTGAGGVPATGVSSAVVNIAALDDPSAGFLQAYPNARPTSPATSSVNYNGNSIHSANLPCPSGTSASSGCDITSNRDIVALDSTGGFTIFANAGPVDVVVDVTGYFTDGTASTRQFFTPTGVSRLFDSRIGGNTLAARATLNLPIAGAGGSNPVIPSGASAAVLSVAIDKTIPDNSAHPFDTGPGPGFLTLFPGGATRPLASDTNFAANSIVSSHVYATLGSDGSANIYNGSDSPIDVVVDAYGYFGPGPTVAVSASPSTISGNGSDQSTVTATVTDAQGNGVNGDPITLTKTGAACGTLSSSSGTTSGGGSLVVTYTASNTAGTCTITAVEGDTGATGSTPITQTATNQAYHITPNAPQSPTVSTSGSPTQGAVTYTVSGVTSANTPTGHIDIALFPSTGPNAPVNTGGVWTFTSSGGPGNPGSAVGQATSNNQTGTSPTSRTQGACGTTCFAYISNVNGTPTTNAPDQVNDVNAPSGGTFTFTLNSFEVDGTIPVVFTEPSTADNGTLLVQANGQPQSTYPFAVGGASNWGPSAPAAPAGSYSTEYVLSVNTANHTFVGCNSLPPGPSVTCNTFTYQSSDIFTYPAQNGGWNAGSHGHINITASAFGADLSGPLTGQQVPTDALCSSSWSILNGPGNTGTPTTLCSAGSDSANSNTNANPDVVDVSYNPSSTSTFSYADYFSILNSGSTSDANVDAPAAPTGVSANAAVAGSAATVTLNWNAVPNENVSQDTNTGTTSGVRAEYDVFRSLVGGSGPGPFNFVGHTTITSGSPPPTTFTDTANGGVTYQYKVVALSSNENGNNNQADGPASAAVSVTTPTALAAPPSPQTPTAPISVLSVVTPGGANATGSLLATDTFKVNFNGPISVTSGAIFTLTDVDGTRGTVTCGPNATCSTSGNVLTVVLTGPPVISLAGSDGTLGYNTTSSHYIAFTAETGVGNGLPWNLPWSGCYLGSGGCASGVDATGADPLNPTPTTIRVLTLGTTTGDNNNLLGHLHHITGVTGAVAGSSSVVVTSYPGDLTTGATIVAFDSNGSQLGSTTVPSTGPTTIPLSSPLVVGEVLQLVYTNPSTATVGSLPSETAQVLVPWATNDTQTDQGSYPGGEATFRIGPSTPGTLGNSQTVPVTIVSNIPNSTVYLWFTADHAGGGCTDATAIVGSTALTGTPQLFQTNGSGNLAISYTTSSCATSIAGTDSIFAQNLASSPTIQTTDFYTYNGPNAPHVTGVSPTSVGATTPTLTTITGTNLGGTTSVDYCSNNPSDEFFITPTSVGSTVVTFTSPFKNITSSDLPCDVQVITSANGESNSGGTAGVDGQNFIAPPTVTAITWKSGPIAGGQHVIIQGTNFFSVGPNGPDVVQIGGTNVVSPLYPDSTSITATTPPKTAGAKNVTVTDPYGQVGTLTNGYTYVAGPLLVTAVQSAAGNVFVTFNEPVCRGTAFNAADWTITGNFTGAHTATGDTIPTCSGATNGNTATSAVITTSSNFTTPGETVTVTYTGTGAHVQDQTPVTDSTAQTSTFTASATPKANLVAVAKSESFENYDDTTFTFDVPVCTTDGSIGVPTMVGTTSGDNNNFSGNEGEIENSPSCGSGSSATTIYGGENGSGWGTTGEQGIAALLDAQGLVDAASGSQAVNINQWEMFIS